MTEEDFKIDRFHETWESGIPWWFIAACIIGYNFKSFRRFTIYLSHYGNIIDLWETPSKDVKNEEIIAGFEALFPERTSRKTFSEAIGIKSRTTFNKYFGDYLKENDLEGRRSFTFMETYKLLEYWQGEGQWGRLKAAKKEMLANILHNKNYERTAEEFRKALGSEEYKPNLVSPKKIKQLIEHIDLNEENQVEDLMGYKETQTGLLWMFGLVMLQHFFKQTKTALAENDKTVVTS